MLAIPYGRQSVDDLDIQAVAQTLWSAWIPIDPHRLRVTKATSVAEPAPFDKLRAGSERSRTGLVACPLKALHSLLLEIACWACFFPVPMACEGQGKEMSFCKDHKTLKPKT